MSGGPKKKSNSPAGQAQAGVKERKKPLFADIFSAAKPSANAALQKIKVTPIHARDTLVTKKESPPLASSAAISGAKSASKSAAKPKQLRGLGRVRIALAVILLALLWYGWQRQSGAPAATTATTTEVANPAIPSELSKRVDYHRNEIGVRLNRERIGVEYENFKSAPPLETNGPLAVGRPDMMNGLPMKDEGYHRPSSRDRKLPLNQQFPDAHVQYSLQEEQALQEQERRQQKAYIEEFIANAERAGYRVQVDKNGQVKVLGRTPSSSRARMPNSQAEEPSSPGSVR